MINLIYLLKIENYEQKLYKLFICLLFSIDIQSVNNYLFKSFKLKCKSVILFFNIHPVITILELSLIILSSMFHLLCFFSMFLSLFELLQLNNKFSHCFFYFLIFDIVVTFLIFLNIVFTFVIFLLFECTICQ